MITLDMDKDDCRNAAEFIEINFFPNLKSLLEIGELDNIDYIRSLLRILDALNEAKEETK